MYAAGGGRGDGGRPGLVGMYEPPPRASWRLAPAVSALLRTPGGHGLLQGAGGITRRLQGRTAPQDGAGGARGDRGRPCLVGIVHAYSLVSFEEARRYL